MARREKKEVDSGAWLNTYADMVTLLLCFFVLLFAMSSIAEDKWKMIVGAFNPDATVLALIPGEDTGEDIPPIDGVDDPIVNSDVALEEMLLEIIEFLNENFTSDVTGFDGDGEIKADFVDGMLFMSFRDNIFFDGDRYYLRPEAMRILDYLGQALERVTEHVGEIRVVGHTTQKEADRLNNYEPDRRLAANRSVEVIVYLQNKDIIDPRKLVNVSYGQWYPVAPFDIEENRAKNRRVEILILQDEHVGRSMQEIYDVMGIEIYQVNY